MKTKQTKRIIAISLTILLVGVAIIITTLVNNKRQIVQTTVANNPTAIVSITSTGFVPAALVVHKGTTIIWTNTNNAPHSVVANPAYRGHAAAQGLASQILGLNETYSYTVTKTGSFGYHDGQNVGDNGTVTVQ